MEAIKLTIVAKLRSGVPRQFIAMCDIAEMAKPGVDAAIAIGGMHASATVLTTVGRVSVVAFEQLASLSASRLLKNDPILL